METSIVKGENKKAIGEFSRYLENVKAPEPPQASDHKPGFNGLALEVMSALKKEMQAGLASSVEIGERQLGTPVDADGIFTFLNDAQTMMDFDTGAGYQKLALTEYALRMFPARVHTDSLNSHYPILTTLRGHPLEKHTQAEKFNVEYLLTGKALKQGEKTVQDYLWLIRFLCREASILGNKEKMALYRNTANILSIAVLVASAGKINLSPEALTYSIVVFVGMKEASTDVTNLLKGEAVLFLPYTKKLQIKTHYHDYLRIMLLTVSEEALLNRICSSLKERFKDNYFTAIRVELDWQSPYFLGAAEKLSTRRSYAVYQENNEE